MCHHPVSSRAPPPIHLLPWAYPSVDSRTYFVDSGKLGRGVRAEFMAYQMVTFLSSMAFLEPGQIFTVRSMTWITGLDGNGEIVEAVQDHPTPIALTLAMPSLIPMPHRWVRRSISNDDLIASIDRVTERLAECQLLVGSVLDQSSWVRSYRSTPTSPRPNGEHVEALFF